MGKRAGFIILVATFLLVFEGLVRLCAADPCGSQTRSTCTLFRHCQWSDTSESCHSSLPCVLESSPLDCRLNTWRCVWSPGKKACLRMSAGTSTAPVSSCTSRKTAVLCKDDRRCLWNSEICKRKPTIVLSVADDLGWYDVSWKNIRSRTPVLHKLKTQGVELDRHYTSRFCAPTRGMLFTGRMAWTMGLHTDLNGVPPASLRCAVSRTSSLLPGHLKSTGGYKTLGFGKWHLGHHTDALTPTARGFDSFVGFYLGSLDRHVSPHRFWMKECVCAGTGPVFCNVWGTKAKMVCGRGMALVNETARGQAKPLDENNIVEDAADLFFANRAADAIQASSVDDPVFVFIGWTAPHDPEFAPMRYIDAIEHQNLTWGNMAPISRKCPSSKRKLHLGMVMAMDEGHRIIVDALDRTGRYEDTIFVFLSDNGAHTPSSKSKGLECRYGSNFPLRGGKYTWFEGGVRTIAFVSSVNFIAPNQRGRRDTSLISANDWKVTLLKATGVDLEEKHRELDHDHWSRLAGIAGSNSTRFELPLQIWLEQRRFVVLFYYENELYKIMQGYPYAGTGAGNVGKPVRNYAHSEVEQPWELSTGEMTSPASRGFSPMYNCHPYCLFNLDQDPQESVDLSKGRSIRTDVLRYAKSVVFNYKMKGVRMNRSGYCDNGYYPTNTKHAVDPFSIKFVQACQAYLPFIDDNGRYKKC